MSWLTDVKSKKDRALDNRKDWGFFCGYCSNSFFGDQQQLDDHQNVGKHQMCKGKLDVYDKELAIKRGLDVRPSIKQVVDTRGIAGTRL